MRKLVIAAAAVAAVGVSLTGQGNKHLNPVVDLLAARQPVFGTAIPSAGGGGGGNRGGGGAAAAGAATTPPAAPATPPAPPKTQLELAKDALAHPEIDYFFSGGMERGVSTGRNGGPGAIVAFTQFADALVEAGAVATKPARLRAPLAVKSPNISRADSPADPAVYVDNISKQLNAGVSIINFVEVDNVDEINKGIAAMRFASKGGMRQDAIGDAPKYWGLTEKEYRDKADVWPLNPNGELLAWAIIETKEGVDNVREIAQVKGLSAVIVGAGTLGGVYTTTNPDGTRGPRDPAAWEAAIQKILAACKEFKKPCGYPAYETDIEARMKQGFDVFIIQTFGERGFKAVEIGRQVSGRNK